MTKLIEKRSLVSRFLGDRGGNFALVTAFVIPVILAAGGVAMDMTNMVLKKAELQDAVDSSALAAASALSVNKKTVDEAKAIALTFFKTQMSNNKVEGVDLGAGFTVDITEAAIAGGGKSFKVTTASDYNIDLNPLTRLLGQKTAKVAASGVSESSTGAKNAISMYLVLDESGSMSFKTDEVLSYIVPCQNWTSANWGKTVLPSTPCYIRKIAALKTAVGSLVKVLNTIDPKMEYVRTAAISYDDAMKTGTSLAWGTLGAATYVNLLPDPTDGGTDSHGAFAKAVDNITKASETKAHTDKTGLTPLKFIVFMTDGENTHYDGKSGDTWAKKSDDDTTASCNAAKKVGITVYTVAFMAPTRGQTLLKACATNISNYYEADDMAGLVAAFEQIGKSAANMVSRLTQ